MQTIEFNYKYKKIIKILLKRFILLEKNMERLIEEFDKIEIMIKEQAILPLNELEEELNLSKEKSEMFFEDIGNIIENKKVDIDVAIEGVISKFII